MMLMHRDAGNYWRCGRRERLMQHVVGRHQQQQPVITEIPFMSVRSHLLPPVTCMQGLLLPGLGAIA